MISFAPTDDQLLVRDMLEALARDVLRPAARPSDRRGALDPQTLDALAATGLIDLALDADVPHMRTSTVIALEALAKADAAPTVAIAAPLGYVQAIVDHGTPAQRAELRTRWTESSFRGAALLLQEPGFDADVTAPRTHAADDDGGFLLNGIKSAVPRAKSCSDFLVVAASAHGRGAYLVPSDAPGVEVMPSSGTLGLRSLDLTEVRFSNVRLPKTARLGGESGCNVQSLADSARVATAAIMTGVASAVLGHLTPYLKERVAHGSALAQKQSVAFRLADMSIDIPSMRWMTWRAAAAMDKGRIATREARLAQLHCAEQVLWITDEGVQLMGGHGYLRDNPVERWYRDARTLATLEGVTGL